MENQIVPLDKIRNRIYTIRGVQVMIDSDLAKMYDVETKYLNLAVKRNLDRFPDKFRFQLTEKEFENLRLQNETIKKQQNLRLQIATSSSYGGKDTSPMF